MVQGGGAFMITAITREPAARIEEGIVTFIKRSPISYKAAVWQHAVYCEALRSIGVEVITLPSIDHLPDSVFVEDVAVVLDEVAVLTSPSAESRREEVPHIKEAIAKYREIVPISEGALLEGGDVLRMGRTLYVGLSQRTNAKGAGELAAIVGRYGYGVIPVAVHGCLHLKTGCTGLDDSTVLVNNDWIDTTAFSECRILSVDQSEPWAANVLRVGNWIVTQTGFPQTAQMIANRGYAVQMVDASEFGKVEGSLTCLSLIFQTP
jgi:dimethylargininase